MTTPAHSSATPPGGPDLGALGASSDAAEHPEAAAALRGAADVHRAGGHTQLADVEVRLAGDVAGDSDHQLPLTQILLHGAEPC